MFLSFGIYQPKKNFKQLEKSCLFPLMNALKAEELIAFCFYYPDRYKGEHLRVWIKIREEEHIAAIKEKVLISMNSYLKEFPNGEEKQTLPLNRLFLNYPTNSIIFFAPNDNPFSEAHDILGDRVLGKICDLAVLIKSDSTEYKSSRKLLIGVRFYFILYVIWSNGNLANLKNLSRNALSFFFSKNQKREETTTLLKEAKEIFNKLKIPLLQECNSLYEIVFEKKFGTIDDKWVELILESKRNFHSDNKNSFKYPIQLLEFLSFQLEFSASFNLRILLLLNKAINKRSNEKIQELLLY